MESAEVGVVGMGLMGSAATYHLSRRGVKVVAFGSAGLGPGDPRVARWSPPTAIPERLAVAVRRDWEDFEQATGQRFVDSESVSTAQLMETLHVRAGMLGAGIRESATVERLIPVEDGIIVRSAAGDLLTDRVIVEEGPKTYPLLERLNGGSLSGLLSAVEMLETDLGFVIRLLGGRADIIVALDAGGDVLLAPTIGRALAELAVDGMPKEDLSVFGLVTGRVASVGRSRSSNSPADRAEPLA